MNEKRELPSKPDDNMNGWTTDLPEPPSARGSESFVPVTPASKPLSSRSRLMDRVLEDNDPRELERAFDGYPRSS